MGDFSMYLRLGMRHIADINGYDHILFITSLCLTYFLKDWKKVLILITAFTIGHSITLALSIYNKIIIPKEWIEFLIPVTILISALFNIIRSGRKNEYSKPVLLYILAMFFGLIHGMGFSNGLRSLMGGQGSIIKQLFGFNLGLELGQILIVAIVLLVSFIFVVLLKLKREWWVLSLSIIISILSIKMIIERFPI